MNRSLPTFALLGLSLFAEFSLAAAPALKPNIVFILADDLGYTDVACYGSRYYETPNIDRRAAQDMRFISGYTCGPNWQPTGAAIMSGRYDPRPCHVSAAGGRISTISEIGWPRGFRIRACRP
jgi:hypothetical protein